MLYTIIFCAVLTTAIAFGIAAIASFVAGRWDLFSLYFGLSLANVALTWMSRA